MFFRNRKRNSCLNKCHLNHVNNNMSLENAEIETKYEIVCNSHRKSFELGLFNGNQITVIRNNDFQNNIIVAVGDSRYILSKEIAKNIFIKEIA